MGQLRVPTVLDDPRVGLSEADRELVDNVEQYGFHWMSIGESAQDALDLPEWRDVPSWSFTVGLYATYGHPEFVAFTLDDEIVGTLFWDLVREIEGGRQFEPGKVYDDALPAFEGQRCAFESVSPGWTPMLFGYADWFYKGREFPVLQYLWPDRNGHFVGDDGVTDAVREAQPILVEPPASAEAPPPIRS
jgi:hypothetical protein